MHTPFNLHFTPLVSGLVARHIKLPSMQFTPPDAGWILWRFGKGKAVVTIRMSYVYPPLVDVWVWADAIAHRLLPITLRIDEEGYYSELQADWADAAADTLRLTLRQTDVDEKDVMRVSWIEPRVVWLMRLGNKFSAFLQNGAFNNSQWSLGDPWPELACELPWSFPAKMAPRTQDDWHPLRRRAWFFLMLAHMFNPRMFRCCTHIPCSEVATKIQFRLVIERIDALKAAWTALRETPCPAQDVDWQAQFMPLHALFDELQALRDGDEVDAHIADEVQRKGLLCRAINTLECAYCEIENNVFCDLMPEFHNDLGWGCDLY